jgi:hypothetical protein
LAPDERCVDAALPPAACAASTLASSSPAAAASSFELQFQLVDEPLALLGALAELLALRLRDHQLQMLDQRLRTKKLGTRLDQRCFSVSSGR